MMPSLQAEELVTMPLHCGNENENYAFNEIFIEALDALIRRSLHVSWGGKKEANLQDFAIHATDLIRLQ